MAGNPLNLDELRYYTVKFPEVPQLPPGYFFATPVTGNGPLAYRLFDAQYITIGTINPDRLGTGATGAGNLYLADDSTWKSIVTQIIPGTSITVSPAGGKGNVTVSVNTASLHSGGLYSQTAPSTAVVNTTESTLIDGGVGSLSIPANGFQVGDAFIAYFSGQISSANNATIEIHLRSNGFILANTGAMTLAASTNKNWEMYVNFVIRAIGAGGVASIATSGRFSYNKNSNNAPESIGFFNLNNTTFNTTIANTLAVTAQWGSNNAINTIHTDIFNLYRVY